LKFVDGNFSFWIAYDSIKQVIFRVREDTTPVQRFTEKGWPGFDRGDTVAFREATPEEVERWIEAHPNIKAV